MKREKTIKIHNYYRIGICCLLLAGEAWAAPLTANWTATASGDLGGIVFVDAALDIVALADTTQTVNSPPTVWFIDPVDAATVAIAGIGTASFSPPLLRFGVNQSVDRIFMGTGGGGDDILDVDCTPSCATWNLSTSFGPVFDATPLATGAFRDIPTDLGLLTLSAVSDVTFQAIVVPEPQSTILLAVAAMAPLMLTRRKCPRSCA